MANYDSPGVTYDSGVLYDSVSPPPATKRTRMAKVKLSLSGMADADVLQLATNIKTAMTGLTSGAKMWARVRAVASAGQGAWSDPAVKIVP